MKEAQLSKIMALKEKSLTELKEAYKKLFDGKKAPSNNKVYLWRKIAYRIQEIDYGGLSAKTKDKVQELIQKYDPINNKTLRPNTPEMNGPSRKHKRDKRLPILGTVITKEYKGKVLQVKILDSGYEYNNKKYKSLSSIAKEVTGAHWNGYLFFSL
ncbi:MAG: DUF2924 domain-containing protein [Candidatus Omnitrophica bacterium]|nr:DUF2924 domain-containing protein [Candidatus Omnitrophota bacterium]